MSMEKEPTQPPFLRKFSNTLDVPLTEIWAGDLYLRLEQRLVTVRKQEIYLTAKEFEILFLLASNPNRVFTYELIMDLVWHICLLESKLSANNTVTTCPGL